MKQFKILNFKFVINSLKIKNYKLKILLRVFNGPLRISRYILSSIFNILFWLLTRIPFYRKLPLYLQKGIASVLSVLIILSSIFNILAFGPWAKKASAAWFNDNWGYRSEYTITNSAALTNRKIKIDADTATYIAAGKMQSDCDDSRFTDSTGKILEYFIDSDTGACNSSSTDYYVTLPVVNNGSTAIYHYYGNINAGNARKPEFYAPYDSLGSKLKGYWKLDESTGSRVDSTYTNDLAETNGVASTTGQVGTAADIERDNTEDLTINDNATLSTGNIDFSFTAWVKAESTGGPGTMMIVGKDDGTNREYMLGYHITVVNRLQFVVLNSGGSNVAATADDIGDITPGAWYFVVGWHDAAADTINIQVNGGTVNSTATGGLVPNDSTSKFQIGARERAADRSVWDGLIDEVRFYKKVLTAAERADLYAQGNRGLDFPVPQTLTPSGGPTGGSEEKATSPVAYWALDEGTGTNAEDKTTNGKDLTLTGSPTWQTEDQCVAGKCLYFDGASNQYAANSNAYNLAGTSITASAWLRPHDKTSNTTQTLISSTSGSNGIEINWAQNANNSSCYIGTGSFSKIDVSTTNVDTNKWHHFVCTWDGSTIRMYIDGVLAGSGAKSGTIGSGTYTVTVGNTAGGGTDWTFKGFVDDVKIYTSALSVDQVKTLYTSVGNPDGLAGSVLGASDDNLPGALSNGLVGYWKMDETSGNRTDSSGNGFTLTDTNTVTSNAGKFGTSGQFTAANTEYLTIADNSTLSMGDVDFTVSAWVYHDSEGANRVILGKYGGDASANTEYLLFYGTAADRFRFMVGDGTAPGEISVSADGFGAPTTGTWYFVVGWHDSKNSLIGISVNGVESTTSYTNVLQDSTQPFRIGASGTATIPWNGRIDEARVYKRLLSANERQQLYNFAPGPVGYWKMDEALWNGTASEVKDASGNGLNGTASGGVTTATAKYGKGGKFDGTNDYVAISDSDTLSSTTKSVSVWIKMNALGTDDVIAGKANEQWLGYGTTGLGCTASKFSFAVRASGGAFGCANATGTPVAGTWYHLEGTYDGTNVRLYVNGVLEGGPTSIGVPANDTFSFDIGSYSGAAATWATSAYIDEVKLYNYPRTQKQIVEDMNAGHPAVGSPVGSAIAHYKFDEGADNTCSGGTNDVCNSGSAGSALDGANNGFSTPATSTSGWTQQGKFGRALNHDGSGDYVTVSDNAAWDSDSVTYSAWIKPTNFSSAMTIVDRDNEAGGNRLVQFYTNTSGNLGLLLTTTNSVWDINISTASNTLTAGAWNYVTATYNSVTGVGKIYINGQEKGSDTATGSMAAGTIGYFIGKHQSSTNQYFLGTIDDVKIYNYALTDSEIKQDMNRGQAQVLGALSDNTSYEKQAANQEYCIPGDSTSCAAPVGRWDFNEMTGQSAFDSSGSGAVATLGANGSVGADDPTWTSKGKVGGALSFDGGDHAVVTDIAALSTAQTIEMWFYAESFPTSMNQYLWDEGSNVYQIQLYDDDDDDGKPVVAFNSQLPTSPSAHEIMSARTWTHLAITVAAGGAWNVYINGLSVGGGTSTNGTPGNINIGRYGGSGFNFNGRLDNIRVFNYVRTAAQIAYDYNKGAPIAHWKMNECQGGSIFDSSGNSFTGTINLSTTGTQTTSIGTGTCTTNAQTPWYNGRTGKLNASLNFDGTDDYVSVADNDNLSFGNGTTDRPFSISAWVYKTASLTKQVIGKYSSATNENEYVIFINLNQALVINLEDESTDGQIGRFTPNNIIALNQWHHIAMTYSGNSASSGLALYVNGVRVDSGDDNGGGTYTAMENLTPNLNIGGRAPDNIWFWGGQLDDVRMYNYALSANQIKQIMNDGGATRFGPNTGTP